MKLRTTIFVLAAAAVAAAGVAIWDRASPTAVPGDPADATQVAEGKILYAAHCASCHGKQLEGQPNWKTRTNTGRLPAPPHDATGHTWHHSDEQLFQITKIGVRPPLAPPGYESDMDGFGEKLSDDQIWAVLAYIKSTWPTSIRKRHAEMSAAAR